MPKGSASGKAPKDKNAPKKPLSSYLIFSNEHRPILQSANKDKKITEIAKLIAVEWKQCSAEDKKKYEDKAKDLKEEYTLKFEEYKKSDEYKQHVSALKKI